MAQSTAGESLASIYEDRIGDATNANEVTGYWVFSAGVALGFLGLVLYYMTAAATMSRGVGYALAALAPAMLMAGAVLRFPLRKTATTLVGVGLALSIASIAWFLWVFPGGWSLTTGNTAVITTYVAGLAIIGVAGSVIPLATDRRDAALIAGEQRAADAKTASDDAAATAKTASDDAAADAKTASDDAAASAKTASDDAAADAAAASRESERAGAVREENLADEIAALTAEIEGLEGDEFDLRSSKAEFELYTDTGDHWRWRLVHDNGTIIASSGESFSSKSMAKKGLGSVKLNSLGAAITEI